MPTIKVYHRWLITDDRGRRRPTRYLMSEADARTLDPTAEPVPHTREVREIPDDPEAMSTSAWQRNNRPGA